MTSFLPAPPCLSHMCPVPFELLNHVLLWRDSLFLPVLFPGRPLLSSSSRFRRSYDGIPHVHSLPLVFPAFFDIPETLCGPVVWGHLPEPETLRFSVGTLCRISTHGYHMPLCGGFVDRRVFCLLLIVPFRLTNVRLRRTLYVNKLHCTFTTPRLATRETHSPLSTTFPCYVSKQTV
jgi:hypothetical protein